MGKTGKKFADLCVGDNLYGVTETGVLRCLKVYNISKADFETQDLLVVSIRGGLTIYVNPNNNTFPIRGYTYCGVNLECAVDIYKKSIRRYVDYYVREANIANTEMDMWCMIEHIESVKSRHHRIAANFMFRK